MLRELEQYFTQRGWYNGTHTFIDIRLEGGFEAFSGRASETWEYRWVIKIPENKEMQISEVIVKGKRFDTLDEVCAVVLKKLKANDLEKK